MNKWHDTIIIPAWGKIMQQAVDLCDRDLFGVGHFPVVSINKN